MGDMADYTNDPSDWRDVALYDYGGDLQCRCCNECGLHWAQPWNSKKWRLVDSKGVIHKCPVNPLPKDD